MRHLLEIILIVLGGVTILSAQHSYAILEDGQTDSVSVVTLGVDVATFLRNNEYHADYQTGYTLPGWQLMPTVALTLNRVRLTGGVYNLTFLGTQRYPYGGWYDHMPHWGVKVEERASGVHLRPVLSLQCQINPYATVSMGTLLDTRILELKGVATPLIAPTSALTLISPLYDPEYSLTRDPAQGAMIQLHYPRLAIEALVDWQGFIYPGDNHQEAFSAFLSTAYSLRSQKLWSSVVRLQATAHHRAGEIQQMSPPDTLHTYLAGTIGLVTQYQDALLGAIEGAIHLLGSSVQDAQEPQKQLGYGLYSRLAWQQNIWQIATDVTYTDHYYAPYGGPLLAPSAHIKGSLWRIGFYPALEYPFSSLGSLRLEGALWWSYRTAMRSRWSHMISLTISFDHQW